MKEIANTKTLAELQTMRTQWGEERRNKNIIPVMNHLKK